MISDFNSLEKHLDSLGMFHMKPGQDRMHKALAYLGLTPLPFKAVQIVGTNGKGSTSTFLSSLARKHGLKTGLYTSPHFISFKERILMNNEYIDDEIWVQCAREVYHAEPELSYFEFLTVLAALIYRELKVDFAVFEAGLGGRFDATTALLCDATIFTPFDLDHVHILGNTLEKIAEDKAHALTKNSQLAITAFQQDKALIEIEKACDEFDIPLLKVGATSYNYNISLKGNHQQQNAHLALSAWRELSNLLALPIEYTAQDLYEHDYKPISHKEENALKNAFIAGRLQHIPQAISPLNCQLLLDGAHNIHAFKNLITTLNEIDFTPDAIVFSCMADKDIDEILQCLNIIARKDNTCKIYLPTIKDNSRAMTSEKLEIIVKKQYSCVRACMNIEESLKAALEDEKKQILICGSLYLLADFYSLYPQFLHNIQQ